MASTEIFFEHDRWGRNLSWSAGLHILVAVSIVVYTVVAPGSGGSNWGSGGVGDAMGVTMVTTVPLPSTPTDKQNVLANDSKGLTQSQPKAEEKTPDAIAIPDKSTKKNSLRKKPTMLRLLGKAARSAAHMGHLALLARKADLVLRVVAVISGPVMLGM